MGSILYVVIPCYNEEKVLPITAPRFLDKLKKLISDGRISDRSRIMFVNDGSKDSTWELIRELAERDEHYVGISQSCNRGHQSSLLAGLMEARKRCDITISIDCDGQDDINAMDEMIEQYNRGFEVVYGVRSRRDTDTFFKRFTAESFYKLMTNMGVQAIYNHADYRLISSRVLDELEKFHEVNLYLRGMVPLVGFPSTSVYYERHERMAGESHYPLSKMISLALNGITSLSIKPIRIITAFGFLVTFLSMVAILWALVTWIQGETVSGWASLICVVCFFGGAILMSLGIIGEYVGKTYIETKARPRYIISERTYEE
uniref:glycosyltransferase family 2 protein n=1 Tax=Eubacterium cellulosolvens TaxID=29322 RepID=UPI000482DD48|nr:glycosyltransferase family 2 protein [[Eubacterium] cellulosolvens]